MPDDTGIELEYLASEKELEVLTLPFQILGTIGKDLLITGVALTEGVWKNVIYSAAEIKKVAEQLIGKPLLVEHGNTREFGAKQVGRVVKSYFEPTLKGIVFQARVSDPMAKRLVKKDILPAVSCSTWMDKRPVNKTIRVGTGYIFAELSLVRVPACDRCFIFHQEQLSAFTSGKGKALNVIKEKTISREELDMREDEYETLSEIEEDEEELMEIEKLEEPKLYAILELPDEESLESLRRVKRVVSYYYGYPHYGYPYRYKKYGYGRYPYKYPYKYPYRYKKGLSEDSKVLLATIELDSKDDLAKLRQTYQIKTVFYGTDGIKTVPFSMPSRLSKEDLDGFVASIKDAMEAWKDKSLENPPVGAPNPDSCAAVVCPVDDKKFEDEEKFLEHWNKEHKEKYGAFKETMTILDALSSFVDLTKGDTKITKMKTGRFVVFIDTGKEGFGKWKIIGNFATEKEARAAAKAKGKPEEKQKDEEEKDEHGCIVGKEEWDKTKEKCLPVSAEEQSAYTDHIKKCMKTGKSMKECAALWKKEEKSAYTDFVKKCMAEKAKDIPDVKDRIKACAAEWKKQGAKASEEKPYKEKYPYKEKKQAIVCPACKKKFPDEKALAKHWKEKHLDKYGPLKKGYKYPKKKGKEKLAYYYYKHKGRYYPYYYRKGKYYKKYKYKGKYPKKK